ncbi:ribosome silencing factor [Candidatus Desantisbacteria bacterium]|nr:ribosome silencing factor [Candidatus Desantisbacteria bacterium]
MILTLIINSVKIILISNLKLNRRRKLFSKQIANLSLNLCEEKKGEDVKIISMKKNSLTDYFVICTANSDVHARAIAEEIEKEFKKKDIELLHRDGYSDGHWILLDYFDVMIHIFTRETRDFYALEKLWQDD